MNAVEAIFRVLLDVSWRASWLILVALALRSLLGGRLPARIVFWVWIAVAIRLLLPFAVPVAWSPFNLAPFAHRPNPVITHGPEAALSKSSVAEPPSLPPSKATALSDGRLSLREKLTLGQWTALVWCAGVVALLLARIWAYGCFVRALQRSHTAASPEPPESEGVRVTVWGWLIQPAQGVDCRPDAPVVGLVRSMLT